MLKIFLGVYGKGISNCFKIFDGHKHRISTCKLFIGNMNMQIIQD